MSFGYSVGDAVLITGLAWKTVQNARRACGEYDELTREVWSCHTVLRRFQRELEDANSTLNENEDCEELETILDGCKKVLRVLDIVLVKYSALSEEERSKRKLWQKIRFGNGKVEDIRDQRGQLTYHTHALSLYLNIHTAGSVGRVERQMKESGGDLKELRLAVNDITAHLLSADGNKGEGSILSTYSNDDKAVWKEFRRELVRDGFRSSVIRRHKDVIKAYIEEIGSRGLLDEEGPHPIEDQPLTSHGNSDRSWSPFSEDEEEDIPTTLPESALVAEQQASRIAARQSEASKDAADVLMVPVKSELKDEETRKHSDSILATKEIQTLPSTQRILNVIPRCCSETKTSTDPDLEEDSNYTRLLKLSYSISNRYRKYLGPDDNIARGFDQFHIQLHRLQAKSVDSACISNEFGTSLLKCEKLMFRKVRQYLKICDVKTGSDIFVKELRRTYDKGRSEVMYDEGRGVSLPKLLSYTIAVYLNVAADIRTNVPAPFVFFKKINGIPPQLLASVVYNFPGIYLYHIEAVGTGTLMTYFPNWLWNKLLRWMIRDGFPTPMILDHKQAIISFCVRIAKREYWKLDDDDYISDLYKTERAAK